MTMGNAWDTVEDDDEDEDEKGAAIARGIRVVPSAA